MAVWDNLKAYLRQKSKLFPEAFQYHIVVISSQKKNSSHRRSFPEARLTCHIEADVQREELTHAEIKRHLLY